MASFVKSLQKISVNDVADVGYKAASLGQLARAGFNTPAGCCILRNGYSWFKEYNRLQPRIEELLREMAYEDLGSVESKTTDIRKLITSSGFPADLQREISGVISSVSGDDQRFLAVRASFVSGTNQPCLTSRTTGPFYYLRGKKTIAEKAKICWSAHWSSNAVLDRYDRRMDHDQEYVAPIVQRMVDSRVSGVLCTCSPDLRTENEIRIEAKWGLGDTVVSGRSMNDLYILRRPGLAPKEKRIVKKTVMAVFDGKRGTGSTEKAVDSEMMDADALTDTELRALGEVGLEIERRFGSPQRIEWAFEGRELFILGSRDIQPRKEKKTWDKGR